MKKGIKKNLIELAIIISVLGGLYATGLHTEAIGFVQRGVLALGFLDPEIEKDDEKTYPKADFSMQLVNQKGEQIAMESLRGKVIFLNIWASWCPPCLAEMPGINALYNDMDMDKVVFIMLSVDDDFTKAIKLHQKKEFNFDIYQVQQGIPALYYSQSIPSTYIINAKGDLVLTHSGMGDFNTEDFKSFLVNLGL